MRYEVRCECGKPFAVTGADAGVSLRCDCGKSVEVPPLHQLRPTAGQDALPAETTLANMLANRQFPDTAECTVCGTATDGVVHVRIACEHAEEQTNRADRAGSFILWLVFDWIVKVRRESRVVGRDVRFRVPVRCCGECAGRLTNADLRTAVRRNRVCASVLDKYPHAQVDRAG